jgi:hypothetical protein
MHQARVPSGKFCGRPAVALTAVQIGAAREFRCRKHAEPNDTPIPPRAIFRLVRVTVSVDVAAVCWSARVAELEAAKQVRAVLEAAGGRPGPAKARSWMARTGA